MIQPNLLKIGDEIRVISPAYACDPARYAPAKETLEGMGYVVSEGAHLFDTDWGYAAAALSRASDFNDAIRDTNVKMVLFSGGEVSNEILPLIDYEAARENPKIYASFSDGTTPLAALTARSGLVTYYGQSTSTFNPLTEENKARFVNAFVTGGAELLREPSGDTIRGGRAEGVLTGGYLTNFAVMPGTAYYAWDKNERYLLVLEDHIIFKQPCEVAKWLAHLSQSGLMESVTGVTFGLYGNEDETRALRPVLERFAREWSIPLLKCEAYGHGARQAVFPFGKRARLDADAGTLALI